jgi:predicted NUDIX family NTP pyrophosphohydrolase
MAARSAGILMYRKQGEELFVLLVHPGGPFWARKDLGAWSIPKGECGSGEDAETAARREFEEELGVLPAGDLVPLGEVVQKGGKRVAAFALAGEFDVTQLKSSSFTIEWPPKSGRKQSFAEVDRAEWLPLDVARTKILAGQRPLLDRLQDLLRAAPPL